MKIRKKAGILVAIIALIGLFFAVMVFIWMVNKKDEWDTQVRVSDDLTEYQSFWVCDGKFAKAENGYYVIYGDSVEQMYFIPDDMSSCEIICTKANCKHEDETCSATFKGGVISNFQYNNGYLFYTRKNDVGDIYLCRCDENGKNRTRVLKIGDHNHVYNANVKIHKNHIFVTELWVDSETYRIVDYDMTKQKKDGYETEIVKDSNCKRITVEDICDNKIMYSIESRQKEKTLVAIYDYEEKTSEILKEIEGSSGFIRFAGNNVVYTSQQGNILFSLDSIEKEIMLNTSSENQLAFDGKYIYIDNVPMFRKDVEDKEHVVSVYDTDGNLIHIIEMPIDKNTPMMVCFFGDESIMFAAGFSGEAIYTYDKGQIDTEQCNWKSVNYTK